MVVGAERRARKAWRAGGAAPASSESRASILASKRASLRSIRVAERIHASRPKEWPRQARLARPRSAPEQAKRHGFWIWSGWLRPLPGDGVF